jgi:hypothetical protein
MAVPDPRLGAARELSPLRKTTSASSVDELVREQLLHFSLDPESALGRELAEVATTLPREPGRARAWTPDGRTAGDAPRGDRIASDAKRSLCFQLAKRSDTLQNPMRKTWQSRGRGGAAARAVRDVRQRDRDLQLDAGDHAHRDCLYACTEWIDDFFQGRAPHETIFAADEPDLDLSAESSSTSAGRWPAVFRLNFNRA